MYLYLFGINSALVRENCLPCPFRAYGYDNNTDFHVNGTVSFSFEKQPAS